MPKAAARRWLASTSTLASSTLPARAVAARSSAGVSCLHGPHQAAQKSTTTGTERERSRTRCSNSASSTSKTAASGFTDPRFLDYHCLERCAGLTARGVAERADRLDHGQSSYDLTEHGVLRREPRVRGGDDVELAAGRAGRLRGGLRHRHHALRVSGVGRRRVAYGVPGAAGAAGGGIAAPDPEVGADAGEDGVVVEPAPRERHERRGRLRRCPLIDT